MLSKENRLIKKADFARVQRFGQRFFSRGLCMSVIQNEKKTIRAGFVVSSRFSKKATERNRIKRLLREIFRQELPRMESTADVVIFAKKAAGRPDNYENTRKAMAELLQKSGLRRKK